MKLGLGTVQFGLSYGISNYEGKTAADEVRAMLSFASSSGIEVLDTAALYGSSEEVLGQCLFDARFRIVTKTHHFRKARITRDDADTLEGTFHESLRKLGRDSVYGLLLHNCDDALSPGGELLLERMSALQSRGLVRKTGVSAYTPEQVERVLEIAQISLVQVPFNVMDQRFQREGVFAHLKAKEVEIHTRSVFLQGSLLLSPDLLPANLAEYRSTFRAFENTARERDISPLHLALGFALAQDEIDQVIVGACSVSQLAEIVSVSAEGFSSLDDLRQLASNDERLINPSMWVASS